MRELILRPPSEPDWPVLLDLANRSVAGVPGATEQDLWVANRRAFDAPAGLQRHWVAEDRSDNQVLAYVGVERRSPSEPGFRVFVVVEPALRDEIGTPLLAHALSVAREEGGANAWFIEYAADEAFLRFLRDHGFAESRRLSLPDGAEASVMTIALA